MLAILAAIPFAGAISTSNHKAFLRSINTVKTGRSYLEEAVALEGPGPTSSFVRDDGKVCVEAPRHHLNFVLATMQASPGGTSFVKATTNASSCSLRGFAEAGTEDTCFTGAKLFGGEAVDSSALAAYDKTHGLESGTAANMVGCSCLSGSSQRAGLDCSKVTNLMGSWVHTFVGEDLICLQGPFDHTVRVLATLKTSPFAPMHAADHVLPQTCKDRGFEKPSPYDPDHCYPPSTLWWSNHSLLLATLQVEGVLTGFFDGSRKLAKGTGRDIASCNCLAGSRIVKEIPDFEKTCGKIRAKHSPVHRAGVFEEGW